MYSVRQAFTICGYNFRRWNKNPRIMITFLLTFILCFLLTGKAVSFATDMDTHMQILEPFIWTFGDSHSILLISLLLLLLFADIPFLNAGTPFYLVRTQRFTWVLGQILYLFFATLFFLLFILLSTIVLCMQNSFLGNIWSETAAILGYSSAGKAVALPAFVKTLEMSTPYHAMAAIFILMLLYTLMITSVRLFLSLRFGQRAGMIGVLALSLYGFLLNPNIFMFFLHLPDTLRYKANVITGWLSPLNHATYHMHNFGYDLLPRLEHTYILFLVMILFFVLLSVRAVRKYSFSFTGTEG